MQARQKENKKRAFSRVNNLIALHSADTILKHCLISQQLNHIRRLMGSWHFWKVTGQNKQLDRGRTSRGRRAERDSAPAQSLSVLPRKRQFPTCNWNAEGLWQRGAVGSPALAVTARDTRKLGTKRSTAAGAQSCCGLDSPVQMECSAGLS